MPKQAMTHRTIDDQLAELRLAYAKATTRLDQKIIKARAGLLLMAKELQTAKTSPQQRTDVET